MDKLYDKCKLTSGFTDVKTASFYICDSSDPDLTEGTADSSDLGRSSRPSSYRRLVVVVVEAEKACWLTDDLVLR